MTVVTLKGEDKRIRTLAEVPSKSDPDGEDSAGYSTIKPAQAGFICITYTGASKNSSVQTKNQSISQSTNKR